MASRIVYNIQLKPISVASSIPVLSNGTCFMQLRGGEQKRATKNRTPVTRGTIEPSAKKGFPTRSGKKLQLETLDIDSRLTGL